MNRGFTFIEVLLALAILGIIAAIVAPAILGHHGHAPRNMISTTPNY